MRYEIILSGSGGQGLITAGIILARAAALYDGKNAVQSQSYGPEARGGASKSEIIISSEEINYPKVQSPNVLVALTQEALDKYCKGIENKALIIIDSYMVKSYPDNYNIVSLPIINAAVELKNVMTTNIITLGVLNSISQVTSDNALTKSVETSFTRKAKESNLKALDKGKELALKYSKK